MIEGPRFSRVDEDFECVDCGRLVRGDGFTNHCPACLTSLHVDRFPGDRAAGCGGRMPAVEAKKDGRKGWMLLHRCERCGSEKWNRVADDDDPGEIARVATR